MDHYYCTCMGWRMNKDPVNARTCKHLKELLGEQYEEARLRWKNPDGFKPSSPKKKAAKAGKKKKAKGEDEDEEDEDDNEDAGPSLKKQGAPKLLLANSFEMVNDPTGWWMSEKLDGVRAYWDPTLKAFLSRNGNPFVAPATFIQGYPTDMALDGELFSGRGEFTTTVSVVRTVNSPHWSKVRYKVFDAPDLKTPFEARVKTLQNWLLKSKACTTVDLVEQTKVTSRDHVVRELKRVESLGGEGLMLRKPGSMYEGRRSSTLLKVKSFYDAEARVTGYEKGKGKNEGVTGSLVCVMESGKTFKVGTGLTDAQRRNPPKVSRRSCSRWLLNGSN
ncbi:hypothetical protein BJ742DRAFT_237190 [Cladochytrium replicatum]|nr:hypothetical protein BJ742DRAFT_237190 [Cladochytrium replicatum]